MVKKQYIAIAESFGINTEGLTVAQLVGAIENAKKAKKIELEQNLVLAQKKADELPADASDEEKEKVLEERIEAFDALSDFMDSLNTEGAAPEEEEEEDPGDDHGASGSESEEVDEDPDDNHGVLDPDIEEEEEELKTPGVFNYGGTLYVFNESTPDRFNFLNKNRTKEEWMDDEVAMELLIEGNSSYIKLLND